MKYMITAAIAAITLTMATPVSGSLLNFSPATSDVAEPPSVGYRLEAAGTDFDAYEWVSPSDNTVLCVALSSRNTGPVGHVCVKTAEPVTIKKTRGTQPSVGFKINTRWKKTRIYEWVLMNNTNVLCSTMSNNEGKFGIQCINTVSK